MDQSFKKTSFVYLPSNIFIRKIYGHHTCTKLHPRAKFQLHKFGSFWARKHYHPRNHSPSQEPQSALTKTKHPKLPTFLSDTGILVRNSSTTVTREWQQCNESDLTVRYNKTHSRAAASNKQAGERQTYSGKSPKSTDKTEAKLSMIQTQYHASKRHSPLNQRVRSPVATDEPS